MKKASIILSAVIMSATTIISCGVNSYNEVTIGKQLWMSENLNVDTFRNGDLIPLIVTDEE